MKEPRLRLTVVLILSTVALGAALRPSSHTDGIEPEAFWARKLLWKNEFSVVLAGDSRVYRGLSPTAMNELLPEASICNFGFSSCALEDKYLSSVEKLLPASGRRIVVLGITPSALGEKAARDNAFLRESARSRISLCGSVSGGRLLHSFRPYWRDLSLMLNYEEYHETYYGCGWVATRVEPSTPRLLVERYRHSAEHDRVSERIIEDMLARIGSWKAKDIQVFGFLVPTTDEMASLEAKFSGYRDIDFPARFKAAGGTWIWLPPGGYDCYDGSHLSAAGAVELSRDLASEMARHRAKTR